MLEMGRSMSSSLDDDQATPIDRTAFAVISNGDTAVELRLLGSFRKANAADCAALNAAGSSAMRRP